MTGLKQVVVLALGLALANADLVTAGQRRPYRVSDEQLQDLMKRIDNHTDAFQHSFDRALDRSPIKGSATEDQIDRAVKSFEQAADALRDRVNDRQFDVADAEEVLRRAASIDNVMMRNAFDAPAQRDWQALRADMDDLARAYGIDWSWSAASQRMPYRTDDKEVERLLKQIGQKAGRLDKSLDQAFERSRIDDSQGRDEIRQSVEDFRQVADRLRDRVKRRQSSALDVEEMLRRGVSIDGYMQRFQLSAQAEQNWRSIRADLDELARAYNVAWNWSDQGYTQAEPNAGFRQRLTGTYQLENARSDDPRRAAEQAVGAMPSDQRQRAYQSLLARLEAPELIAIERDDSRVTMSSTRGRRVTVEADGRSHREEWSEGRTMSTRATLEGERLVVATTGDRDSDFTATFDPMEDGRSLRLTRTIDADGLRQPVTVRSFYRRLSDDARWGLDGARRDARNSTGSRESDFAVPDGTRFVARLDSQLSAASARAGDLFTLTTSSPPQYEGAVIHGVVAAVDEVGRAGMTLSLRSIRLRDGRSYQFDGVIEDVRTPDGETIRVDREGTVDEGGQTRKAVERGAIGAALGAVIGAVAGGARGAAIGAAVGAGVGAGTVIAQGRDRLELPRGTELTITSGAPGEQRNTAAMPR